MMLVHPPAKRPARPLFSASVLLPALGLAVLLAVLPAYVGAMQAHLDDLSFFSNICGALRF